MKRKVLMWILVAIVAVGIVGCGNSTQNTNDATSSKFEDFRLKWAENDGTIWNYKNLDGEDIFTLVSLNNYNVNDTTACFAKAMVCPTEKELFLFVSNVNLRNAGNINISANHKTLELSAFESERIKEHFIAQYYATNDSTKKTKEVFGNADSLTFFLCNRSPEMTRLIYFTIDIFHGRDTIKFEFESKKTIMDMMKEMKSGNK